MAIEVLDFQTQKGKAIFKRLVAVSDVRCAGEDEWVFIAVRDDAEFARFCRIVGRQEWLDDPQFADQESRWWNQALLDREIFSQ